MAQEMLESSAVSAFCGSMATMISAGIQVDEAAYMLAENREESQFQRVCNQIYAHTSNGEGLAGAMSATGAFPRYAVDLVTSGERAGHLEEVLRNLEVYYDEEDRLYQKLRSSVGYPAALLCIMTVILAFTVAVILPVFRSVYDNLAGSLAGGSTFSVGLSSTIGYVALVVMAVLSVLALVTVAMTRSAGGRDAVMGMLTRIPATRRALYQLAVSRFTAALGTLVSSGVDDQESMRRATEAVDQPMLRGKLDQALESMMDVDHPRSLTQALSENEVFEPLYLRMLEVGMRTGKTDETLLQLSSTFFDDAIVQLDQALDNIEPIMAALLTVAVGATLIAVMLPLIGIMTSIG